MSVIGTHRVADTSFDYLTALGSWSDIKQSAFFDASDTAALDIDTAEKKAAWSAQDVVTQASLAALAQAAQCPEDLLKLLLQ